MSGQLEFGEEDRTAILGRAWELALHLLASKVSTVAFATYIQPIQPISYTGSVITLGISNAFYRERIEKNHANAIRSALEFHLDTTGLQVVFAVLSRDQQRSVEARRAESGKGKLKPGQTAFSLDTEPGDDAIDSRETQYSTGSRTGSAREQRNEDRRQQAEGAFDFDMGEAVEDRRAQDTRNTTSAPARQSTPSSQSSFGNHPGSDLAGNAASGNPAANNYNTSNISRADGGSSKTGSSNAGSSANKFANNSANKFADNKASNAAPPRQQCSRCLDAQFYAAGQSKIKG